MIRHLVSTLLQRLTTDTGALRGRIATLEAELEAAVWMRDHHKAQSETFHRLHDHAVDERDRLRAMVGNTEPTASERLMLGIVRETPGLMAKEYGAPFFIADAKADLVKDPTSLWAQNALKEEPPWYAGEYASKHLTSLHRKGLVRREKAGQSYRYWPSDG